jgi:hypothetical protein
MLPKLHRGGIMQQQSNALTTFQPLSGDDPALQEIRKAWTGSAPDRHQYHGLIAKELDYYFNQSMAEISILLHKLSGRPSDQNLIELDEIISRLKLMTTLCDSIGNFLLKHLQ